MKRVLIIEDDEISMRFIAEAMALLPIQIDECHSFTEAKVLLQQYFYELILSDINLGDGNLFQEAKTLPKQIKKIAMSAEISLSISARLKEIGIDCILSKPMSISAIHQVVTEQLEISFLPEKKVAIWDDRKALSALSNNSESLKILKNLFKTELPQMLQQINIEFKKGNHQKIVDILHKLKASCGFLGANKLLAECYMLEQNISQQSITHFMLIAKQTMETI